MIASALAILSRSSVAQDPVSPTDESPQVSTDNADDDTGSSLSSSLGITAASAYYFRGIPQENQGVIAQPAMDFGIAFWEAEDDDAAFESFGANAGVWNSFHYSNGGNPWYEADLYVGLSAGLAGGVELSLNYTYLYGPNAAGLFAEELSLQASFDSDRLLGAIGIDTGDLSLSPHILIVREVAGGSDGLGRGGDLGTYLELGIEPSVDITLSESDDLALTVSAPIVVGLDLGDYYETSTNSDDTLGWIGISPTLATDLSFIPARLGTWSVSASANFLFLGDGAQDIGQVDFNVDSGDSFEFYVSAGLTISH